MRKQSAKGPKIGPATIRHQPYQLLPNLKALALAFSLTAEELRTEPAGSVWTYRVNISHRGSRLGFVTVYDETGYCMGKL